MKPLPQTPPTRATRLHEEAIVIDSACPGDYWRQHREDWSIGGVTACALTVGWSAGPRDAIYDIANALNIIRASPGLLLATRLDDIQRAKHDRSLAVILHFQGTEPIEYEVGLLEVYWRIGVRIVQLAYNRRNPFCDGCEEPHDAGLSLLGRKVISELNRLGILIDLTHVGIRSSLETIAASSAPCIASHSNAAGLYPNRRNLTDDVIRAIAAKGGVVGVNGFPSFVSPSREPSLDQLIDHIAYIDELVGPGHVGLGLDYYEGSPEQYATDIAAGVWSSENYGPPPYHYPSGIGRPSQLPALTERLLQRGFDESAVRGVLGENWLRVYRQVWAA